MALKIEDLRPTKGSAKKGIRVGRGPGSGKGKTSGKGHKGQRSRSGGGTRPGFEGGQTPLYMRSPKKGFKNFMRKNYTVINLDILENRFNADEEVTPASLKAKGIVKQYAEGIKLLGEGQLSKPLNVKVHAFSKSATDKITAAGGKAEVI